MAGYGNYISAGGGLYADMSGTGLIPAVWSTEVLRYATPSLWYNQVYTTRIELGRKKGDTIYVPIFGAITALGTTALTSGTEIAINVQPIDRISMVIDEFGNGISFESALNDVLTNLSLRDELLMSLAENYAVTWNAAQAANTLACTHWASVQNGAGSVFFSSGTITGAGTQEGTLDQAVLATIRDQMVAAGVPFFADGYYRLLVAPATLRNLRKDSVNLSVNYYTNLDARGITTPSQTPFIMEDFLIMEAKGGAKSGITAGTSLACGRGAFHQVFGLPMEVRYEPNYKQDFGRLNAYAWYLIGTVGRALADKGTYAYRVYTTA